MTAFKRLAGAALALGILSTAAVSRADVESARYEDGHSAYKFRDDLLNSDVQGPKGGNIVVRTKAVRSTLIRPRTSFVYEMFKSVEQM